MYASVLSELTAWTFWSCDFLLLQVDVDTIWPRTSTNMNNTELSAPRKNILLWSIQSIVLVAASNCRHLIHHNTVCNCCCGEQCNAMSVILVHTDDRPFTCKDCGIRFRRRSHLKLHRRIRYRYRESKHAFKFHGTSTLMLWCCLRRLEKSVKVWTVFLSSIFKHKCFLYCLLSIWLTVLYWHVHILFCNILLGANYLFALQVRIAIPGSRNPV